MKPPKQLIATIHPLLAKRWSPRSFTGESINDMKLLQLFEAARWSPSSRNEQPWHFIYADNRNQQSFSDMHECLVEGNQSWTDKASVLIVTLAKNNYDHKDRPNAHAAYDLGGAVANLTIQALELGLYVHQMGGIQKDKIIEKYAIPDGWTPMTMVAVGFLGDPSNLEEKLQDSETGKQHRKRIKDIVSINQWSRNTQIINP